MKALSLLLPVCSFLIITTSLSGQNSPDSKSYDHRQTRIFTAGVQISFNNYSYLDKDHAYRDYLNEKLTKEFITPVSSSMEYRMLMRSIGINFYYSLNPLLSITSGIHFSNKGAKVETTGWYENALFGKIETHEYNIWEKHQYIDFPLGVELSTRDHINKPTHLFALIALNTSFHIASEGFWAVSSVLAEKNKNPYTPMYVSNVNHGYLIDIGLRHKGFQFGLHHTSSLERIHIKKPGWNVRYLSIGIFFSYRLPNYKRYSKKQQ